MQDLNGLVVLLCQCLGFIQLIGFKSLIFGLHQECDGVLGHVICKHDEVLLSLLRWGACWPPYIGVYFITKVLCWWTDSDLRDRLTSHVGENAGIAGCLLRAGIQLDSCDCSALNKLSGAADGNMAKVVV